MKNIDIQKLKLLVSQVVYYKSASSLEYHEEGRNRQEARNRLVSFCSSYEENDIRQAISSCPGNHMLSEYDWKEFKFEDSYVNTNKHLAE